MLRSLQGASCQLCGLQTSFVLFLFVRRDHVGLYRSHPCYLSSCFIVSAFVFCFDFISFVPQAGDIYGIVFFLCINEIATRPPTLSYRTFIAIYFRQWRLIRVRTFAQSRLVRDPRELENRSCHVMYSDPEFGIREHDAFLACWRLTSALGLKFVCVTFALFDKGETEETSCSVDRSKLQWPCRRTWQGTE